MKALYRKYRPKSLSEVIGQEQVTTPLKNAIKNHKVSHAYLFIGPRGTGKTSVARIFAHEVNQFPYELEDNYVDIIEIDGASNRGIDNIRELREKVLVAPSLGQYKIYIIDEVHMLTKEAFNALLKTLEEPPTHAIFIMATTDAYKVPITITSRAQTFTFKLATPELMLPYLQEICQKEGIKIAEDALKIVINRGGGSFRDTLSLLDQVSTLSDAEISKQTLEQALGLPEDEKITILLTTYLSGNVVKITTTFKDLLLTGVKPETLAEELITKILSAPAPELLPLLTKLPEVKAPFAEAKLLTALTLPFLKNPTSATRAPQSAPTPSVTTPNLPTSIPQSQTKTAASSAPSPLTAISSDKNSLASSTPQAPLAFDWSSYLSRVKSLNEAVYSQLNKCQHSILDDELHLYPEKKIAKTILSRDNNKKILVEASAGIKITIHDAGDFPDASKKDPLLSKISDIMGGGEIIDGGGTPF